MPAFDHAAAVAYARKWAGGRNPVFPDMGGSEDCTNFISQCLGAGGWPMVDGYYYFYDNWWCNPWSPDKHKWTYSWVSAPDMAKFFDRSRRASLLWSAQGIIGNAHLLQPGDVLQYGPTESWTDVEHSCMVT